MIILVFFYIVAEKPLGGSFNKCMYVCMSVCLSVCKGCWLSTLDWWGYKVTALIQGLALLSTGVVKVIYHHARPSPRLTVMVRQVMTIHQVVSVMSATGSFAEDAGQERASLRLAMTTIRVAPWCGTADTHGFGIFNAM